MTKIIKLVRIIIKQTHTHTERREAGKERSIVH
jgi:hypothetical protein